MEAKDTVMSEEPPILSDEEKLGCSLISQYPYNKIRDVIDEACLHQRDADAEWYGEAKTK